MKYFKDNSEIELRVQKIEELMRRLDISLNHNGVGLEIGFANEFYEIYDIEGESRSQSFPRLFDSEKIVKEM